MRPVKFPPGILRIDGGYSGKILDRTLRACAVARLSREPAQRQSRRLRARIQLSSLFVAPSCLGAPSERFFFAAEEQLCEVETPAVGSCSDRISQFSGRFGVSPELAECVAKPHASINIPRRKRQTLAKESLGALELSRARADRHAHVAGAHLAYGRLYRR